MTYLYQQQIEESVKVSTSAVLEALNEGEWDVLYFAKEEMITELIDEGRIDEDFGTRYQVYQEEMRSMMSEFA